MLERLFALLRHILASRTIDGIVGELESKINKLDKAEGDILAYVGIKHDVVAEAEAAFEALKQKTAAEVTALAAKIEKSRKTREKLSIIG